MLKTIESFREHDFMIRRGTMEEGRIYREMYIHLFNAITEALEASNARNYGQAEEILIRARQEAEAWFVTVGNKREG